MPKHTYILSLGGSLIVPPAGIDTKFIAKFKKLIATRIKKGDQFFIITGGGITCRNYIKAANKITRVTRDDSDWLGIHTTRLNAHLIRTVLRDIAHPEIITNPTKPLVPTKPVVIASGFRPGSSTDYVAVLLAEKYRVETIINLSNIDYVYDKDPRQFKDAKKFIKMTWPEFIKIVGTKWDPGLNAPFDPVASQKAKDLGLRVIIINGKKINNLEKCLNGSKFSGTTIK